MTEQKKSFAKNRKAKHDYFIEDVYEAGIALKGTEVKSIRQGKANLKESYAMVQNGEVFLIGMHISPYEKGNIYNRDPIRTRKLLLTKREIRKLEQEIQEKGKTLVPLELYEKNGFVKLALAVATGKKMYDKRETIAKKRSGSTYGTCHATISIKGIIMR